MRDIVGHLNYAISVNKRLVLVTRNLDKNVTILNSIIPFDDRLVLVHQQGLRSKDLYGTGT